MISDNILSEISTEEKSADCSVSLEEKEQTFLVFKMNSETFAVQASLSREIMRNMTVYPLPFVPLYVKGVLNRHGDPYTVIDPMIILGKEAQSASLFLVLNIESEQLCLKITDVNEFLSIKEQDIKSFSSQLSITHFEGTIVWKEKDIPILNCRSFVEKLRLDLNNA